MILQLAIEETWIDHIGLLDCTSWPPGLNVSDTWIGRLGDLGRYRMAIQEEDPQDKKFSKSCCTCESAKHFHIWGLELGWNGRFPHS